MDDKERDEFLKEIMKSGFPLELRTAELLEGRGYSVSSNQRYGIKSPAHCAKWIWSVSRSLGPEVFGGQSPPSYIV